MKKTWLKRGLGIFLTGALVTCAALPAISFGADENLVKNGGFEEVSGDKVAGWTPYLGTKDAIAADCSMEIKTDSPAEGKNYLSLKDGSAAGTVNIISDEFKVTAGDTLNVSMKVKGYSGSYIAIIRYFSDAKAEAMDKEGRVSAETKFNIKEGTGDSWKEVKQEVTVPDTAVKAYMLLYGVNASLGTCDFDDIKVLRTGGGTTQTPPPTVTPDPGNLTADSVLADSVALMLGKTEALVKGEKKPIDKTGLVKATAIEGRTVVPVRFIAESYGADVAYDEATQTVTVKLGDKEVKTVIGEKKITVDGKDIEIDVAAFTDENDRTLLPLRAFVQDGLGKTIFWKETGTDEGLILISDKAILEDPVSDTLIQEIIAKF